MGGGEVFPLGRLREPLTALERAGVVVTRADVLLAVDQAYFRTLKAQAVLTVAQQTVQERQTVTDRVNALAQAKLNRDSTSASPR